MIKVFGSKVGKEELEQVQDSIDNQWLGAGPKVKEFEYLFGLKINSPNYIMIDNASNGMFMAIQLLNLPVGSEIIIPTFTWISCAHAIRMCGCIPVFCDVDLQTQNVTAALIAPCITTKTKAIMVVHYAGLPVDMDPIMQFGLPVIEDAAHAADSLYKGKHCGTIGDMGVYSYDSMKNIAIGEGGGFTCVDKQVLQRASVMRGCGLATPAYAQAGVQNTRWWEQEAEEVSIKMKVSDIAAGFGLAQLNKLVLLQAKRKQIWDTYQKELATVGDIILPTDAPKDGGYKHSYFTFLIKTNSRDELSRYLYEHDIYTTLRFYPLHLMKIYRTGKKLENAELLKETALNIPLHPDMDDDDVTKVIAIIKSFYNV
ncbi:DegT/DnrJ/EryC1/StrS family aminotransferase [Mucilaginibacter sp. HMF5004]|uniref:DegT/DnrJ/EryC1/StrS family aminotransferase n=1 Tax=Mucilaginibacter rivuli TaxID=2857527 RepID=UPI001C5D4F0F|nr:DegT/DnrJ/EryC1/StrS family aminotransferase [Mucilaginibacter rivuli]MBW4891790.1 DegT/DnrJ/EryC1/StrS family aminotransferase [Mucilaginibacter rivuli]